MDSSDSAAVVVLPPEPMTGRWTTSASNVHTRIRCTGSHYAEMGLPEERDGEASNEGIYLHACYPIYAAGQKIAGLSPEHEDLLHKTHEHVKGLIARTKLALNITDAEPFEFGYERELMLFRGMKGVLPGHCDYWLYWPRVKALLIVDEKYGRLEVDEAPANWQLRSYACQAAQEWEVDNCVVAIVQPRLDYAHQVTMARYSAADIATATEQLLRYEEQWTLPGQPRTPTWNACRYCKAQLICEERNSRITAVEMAKGKMLMGLGDMMPGDFEQLFTAVKLASMESIQDAVKAEARKRIAENRMPGYGVKPNSPRREIEDTHAAFEALTEGKTPLSVKAVMSASKLSLGVLEAAFRAKYGGTIKAAKEQINTALAKFITKSTPEPSIIQLDPSTVMLERTPDVPEFEK